MNLLRRIIDGTPITAEDVYWCYRNLLGREPESEQMVQQHMSNASFRALVGCFVESKEFRNNRTARSYHPFPLPAARIDVNINAEQLAAAISKVRTAWSHLGELRPHFSVLTSEKFLPHNLPGSIDHFWASGDNEAAQVIAVLQTHGFDPAGKVCVEYGCGVGRVTTGFAQYFGQVHAYDISPGHQNLARQRAQERSLSNISFVLCAESFLEDLQPCDFFYSHIVFQHNPPPLIRALVQAAVKALKPGGIAIFQVPTYATDYSFSIDDWLESEQKLDMEMHCLPQTHIFEAIAQAGCATLEVREDYSTGDASFISNTFVVRRPPAQPAVAMAS
jgi:SAM-dependent methyltransferase